MLIKKINLVCDISNSELVSETKAFLLKMNVKDSNIFRSVEIVSENDFIIKYEYPVESRKPSIYCFIRKINNSISMKYSYHPTLNVIFLFGFSVSIIGFLFGFLKILNFDFLNEKYWIFGILAILNVVFYLQLYFNVSNYHFLYKHFIESKISKAFPRSREIVSRGN